MAQQNVDPISGNVIGAKKQTSWFTTQVDFENSFKFWFALMWQNNYIQLFLVGFSATLAELIRFDWVKDTVSSNFSDGGVAGGIFTLIGLITMPIMAGIIIYKGFYQFWNDISKGQSR